ncbi:(4Fe-4S)-binding protein [Archaeoglobales archaeon]|nr:MAG: (4Fe-4S)-binding protein [Archaeoglobales archaeon]
MKQITVISGKGGTGKTTIAAMFYALSDSVIADCDVDAPNLHILLKPNVIEELDFFGMKKAVITDLCTQCGLCYELCKFHAVVIDNGDYFIDTSRCEGCAFCYNACPDEAIEMVDNKSGKLFVSKTDYGYFVHALLNPGEENSGKLVSEVRMKAKEIAERERVEYLIVDGAPGIGCPVIASLGGVDVALIVAEPSMSGLNDMARVIRLCEHFKIKTFALINKYNLNERMAANVEYYCKNNDIEILGKIPYDENIVKQISNIEFPFKGNAASKIAGIWNRLKEVV